MRFESEKLDCENWQGNAVVNYTEREVPFTRIIEHKHFEFGRNAAGETIPTTVITREYPTNWQPGDEPYYPINDERNTKLYEEYAALAEAKATWCLPAVWAVTSTTTWTRPSLRRSTW